MERNGLRPCVRCGVEFMPRRRGGKEQKYHSRECARAAYRDAACERKQSSPPPTKVCEECGRAYIPARRSVDRQRFCDAKCLTRAKNRRERRARLPLKNPAPEPKACAHCGKEFLPKRRDRIYCYESWCAQSAYQARVAAGEGRRLGARTAHCGECGAEFVAERPEARWCSKRCANRHWGRVRARQRGRLSEAKYTDLEIFERDGWRCHLCGTKVRRDVDRLHPDGATIDHLIPTSLGGVDEPANVATAHRRCNAAKATRAVGEQLALI